VLRIKDFLAEADEALLYNEDHKFWYLGMLISSKGAVNRDLPVILYYHYNKHCNQLDDFLASFNMQ
jgi:hypothetical protein